jgi:hypothetical protein
MSVKLEVMCDIILDIAGRSFSERKKLSQKQLIQSVGIVVQSVTGIISIKYF